MIREAIKFENVEIDIGICVLLPTLALLSRYRCNAGIPLTQREIMFEATNCSKSVHFAQRAMLGLCMILFCFSAVDSFISDRKIPTFRSQTHNLGRIRFNDSPMPLCTLKTVQRGRLFMSSSSSTAATKVVFQKIVKPPTSVPPALFLANLVEYIQDHFELPQNLPMVYEKQQDCNDEYVLSWDSPLSSAPKDTRLNVQIVAIYTNDDDENTVPDMAMVVVNKDKSSPGKSVAPMMQNLFDESEKQILRALDRGLDNVQQGKVKFTEKTNDNVPKNVRSIEEAIDAEIIAEKVESRVIPSNDDVIMDTTAKTDSKKPVTADPNEDYAVAAAKKAVAKRNGRRVNELQGGDYAVEAAKRAAQSNAVDSRKIKPTVAKKRPNKAAKPKRFTISTPKQRAQQLAQTQAKKKNTKEPLEGLSASKTTPSRTAAKDVEAVNVEKKAINNTRSLNLSIEDASEDSITNANRLQFETLADENANHTRTVSQAQMQRDVMEAAQKAMSEFEDVEMTPEELLSDVMKFGEEKDKDRAAGAGFVSGAFEKAKELLQEQKKQRVRRLNDVAVKEKKTANIRLDIIDSDGSKGTLTAEEELKRIFEAGERLADGRIEFSQSQQTGSAMTETEIKEQEELDALISGEKTVSGYARSLDDELVELEVRINKSPGEELDGPAKNPQFDIFSGPEVYNPNVDPETAVNWPGAQPGTKDLRLPKELDEAVKQAKFAAEVLTNMKEVEEDGGNKFFVGTRELSSKQVENIRTVVTEAVEIGLIDDPLEYLSERSRMQMVVDEMMRQPQERYRDIASNFRDLLLSDNFVRLIKERLEAMADRDLDARRRDDDSLEAVHEQERKILGTLVEYAQLLLKEARALGAELEASQLEIVRSICQVAMDPSHKTEEDTANALTDAVRDMRPLLDDVFVAYLKYAIAEEEGRLARAGLLDDPEHNEWLFVLKIVQQGVYTEISRGINRYIEHIMYILRMETKTERRMLLSKIIDNLPTMDVRPFVQVVDKIVASLGDSAKGEFDGYVLGEMTNKILQLRRDVKELLPPERIQLMSRDADEWAEKQKQRLREQRKVTKQRLKAAQDTTDYDDEIRLRGEMERMT